MAGRSRRLTLEPASRLLADDVPGYDKDGSGSEIVDRNLDNPEGGTEFGVLELLRIPDSSTSLQRWKSATGTGPAAEGRSDAWPARK